MSLLTNTAMFFIFLIFCLYVWLRDRYRYWSRLGVYSPEASFPFGHVRDVFLGKMHLGMKVTEMYDKTRRKHPYVGLYLMHRKTLMINDTDLIKNVLVKDFNYFMDHGLKSASDTDPLSQHLAGLSGERWKNMRAKLTPAFTTNKMKYMFETMVDCVTTMGDYLKTHIQDDQVVNVRDIFTNFGIDVIGSCAFGLNINTFQNPDSEFKTMGTKLSRPSKIQAFKQFLSFAAPELIDKLDVSITPLDVEKFFIEMVTATIKYREDNNFKRNDFLQLLIDMKKKEDENFSLTIPEMTAQVFFFFLAGYETSAATSGYLMYELAKNPHIQYELIANIDAKMEEADGILSYEVINDIPFLNWVIEETLRLYPSLPFLFRVCVKDYLIPDTEITIEKGIEVLIPVMAIQRDPVIFENPLKFNPERFSPENKAKRNQYTYIPFGEGPRICIGSRFALMQLRLAVLFILTNYKVSLCDETPKKLNFNPASFTLSPAEDIHLRFIKRSFK